MSPVSDRLTYANIKGQITTIDIANNSTSSTWQAPVWLSNLSYSPDGSSIAGVDLGNFTAYVYSLDGVMLTRYTWDQSTSPVLYGGYFSPDWTKIAWVARSTLQVMTIPDGKFKPSLDHQDAVSAFAWSPDSKIIATASAVVGGDRPTPLVYLWDAEANNLQKTITTENPIQSLSFSPDSTELAILDAKGVMMVFPVVQ